jgi:O-succinylbenzoic acid--CoA ligase
MSVESDNEEMTAPLQHGTSYSKKGALEKILLGDEGILDLSESHASDLQQIPQGFSGVLISTSGSTANPKTVMLSRDSLIEAAHMAHSRLGGPGQWINPLSPWCVAGLMTRVRALVAGCPHQDSASDLTDIPKAEGVSYICLVPVQLHRALANPQITTILASYSRVLIGGGPVDPRIRREAEDRGIPVIATYGMSETCGGVVYDGVPLDSVEIDFEPSGADEGRVILTTPTAFSGYLGEPKLTAEVLRSNRFKTSDRGCIHDGRLEILGRIDEVVTSGGVNVDLAQIQAYLDAFFPEKVACFSIPDPVWGSTVILASTGPSQAEILEQLETRLESAARPRGFLTIDALPRTTSGKIDREHLKKIWRQGGQRTSMA